MGKINLACIIEDDPVHLFITKKSIKLTGKVENFLVYANGKEAFEGLKSLHDDGGDLPDVIFLDINMPIWDGWQFLEGFKTLGITEEIPVHIFTSSSANEDIEKAKEFNLQNSYYVKPVSKDIIKSILNDI